MKNIAFEHLIEIFAARNMGQVRWTDLVPLARMDAGQSSDKVVKTLYSEDDQTSLEKGMAFLQAAGYVVQKEKGMVSGLLTQAHKDYVTAYVEMHVMGATDHTVTMTVVGDFEEVKRVDDWFKVEFEKEGSIISTATELNNHGRVIFDKTFIPAGTAQMARQSFYPWLKISLEEYYKAFMESKESILVMFGPAGMAKSTFLRSLIASGNYNAMLAYNKEVVEAPSLLRQFYQSSTAKILAYEDIDKHLARRESDNALMPSFLNAADGVVQHVGKKIVFITNLSSVDRIDPALLRAGRCFDILPFPLLSQEEAAAVRVDMQLAPKDFGEKKGWSVAEALATDSAAQQTINRFGRGIGF